MQYPCFGPDSARPAEGGPTRAGRIGCVRPRGRIKPEGLEAISDNPFKGDLDVPRLPNLVAIVNGAPRVRDQGSGGDDPGT